MRDRFSIGSLACAAILVLVAMPVVADDEGPMWMEASTYLQGAGVYAFEEFKEGSSTGNSADNSLGFDIRAGIRSNPWFAVEVHFDFMPDMNATGRGGSAWATTVNARVYPLTDMIAGGQVQPYALVGLGASSFRTSRGREIGFATRWGGGVDYYLTDEVVLTVGASYVWSLGTPVKDMNYVSLSWGAMYRFY